MTQKAQVWLDRLVVSPREEEGPGGRMMLEAGVGGGDLREVVVVMVVEVELEC